MLEKFKKAGERIEFMREYRGMSREDMAKQLNIPAEELYRIEEIGRGLTGSLLFDISRMLKIDHNYIFEGFRNRIPEDDLLKAIAEFEGEEI